MRGLFRNREIKNIIIISIILTIVFYFASSLIIDYSLDQISSNYAEENIQLAGAILEKHPELENEVVEIIAKGGKEENYSLGLAVMDKYSYNEELPAYKNHLVKATRENIDKIWILMWISFTILLTVLMVIIVKPIFDKIKNLSIMADNMVEGKFNDKLLKFKEGDLYIFYDKFTTMGERLETAVNNIQQEKIALKDIISDISHQLKTPLAALISYNDIMHNHKQMPDSDKDMFISLSSEQLDRMQWLITTLLKYARIESNVVKYNKDATSLSNTISESISPLKLMAEEKDIDIKLDFKSAGNYEHDTKWLGEAISNIVKNAIEHTAEGGEIQIKLDETPLSVGIEIRDNGEGIEKDQLKKIFNRFYKGENSLNPKSIGIGLSLSKKIIEAHQGNISVESEVGKGTAFYISFFKTIV